VAPLLKAKDPEGSYQQAACRHTHKKLAPDLDRPAARPCGYAPIMRAACYLVGPCGD